ncbi:hypothetical protein [Sphingomonas koreensis]
MALNTLTLNADFGYVGRPFSATIVGLSAGSTVEAVSRDGAQGFYVLGGKLLNDALPYSFNAVVLRETLAGTGSNNTPLSVTGYSLDNPAPQAPPDGTALVADGSTVSITDTAGSPLVSGTASVDGNTLDGVALPSNAAMLTDGQASVDINQFDNSGDFAATVAVANNALTLKLANATTRIVVDMLPVDVKLQSGTGLSANGRINIASGALTGVTLPSFYSLVNNGLSMSVPVTGTYTNMITPQVDANGTITGFTLS